jgi:hypothetical protein
MISTLCKLVVPAWARAAMLVAAGVALLGIGWIQGERSAGEAHLAYVSAQATRTVAIARAQAKVVQQVEVRYQERIRTIYLHGETIETHIPQLVTPADVERFGVHVGFVRLFDAAWSGDAPGPSEDADREPAAVSLADVAQVEAENATTCRAWREQALGWRDFYDELKRATDGGRTGEGTAWQN